MCIPGPSSRLLLSLASAAHKSGAGGVHGGETTHAAFTAYCKYPHIFILRSRPSAQIECKELYERFIDLSGTVHSHLAVDSCWCACLGTDYRRLKACLSIQSYQPGDHANYNFVVPTCLRLCPRVDYAEPYDHLPQSIQLKASNLLALRGSVHCQANPYLLHHGLRPRQVYLQRLQRVLP